MKGVGYHKASGKWKAHIYRNGKNEYIGSYDTEAEAERAAMRSQSTPARKKPSVPANPFAIPAQ